MGNENTQSLEEVLELERLEGRQNLVYQLQSQTASPIFFKLCF